MTDIQLVKRCENILIKKCNSYAYVLEEIKIYIIQAFVEMNTYHTFLNSGDNNYSFCSA